VNDLVRRINDTDKPNLLTARGKGGSGSEMQALCVVIAPTVVKPIFVTPIFVTPIFVTPIVDTCILRFAY
jgi:hypothetical protein